MIIRRPFSEVSGNAGRLCCLVCADVYYFLILVLNHLARTINVRLCPLKLMAYQFGKVYGSAVDRLPTSFIQALVGFGTLTCLCTIDFATFVSL